MTRTHFAIGLFELPCLDLGVLGLCLNHKIGLILDLGVGKDFGFAGVWAVGMMGLRKHFGGERMLREVAGMVAGLGMCYSSTRLMGRRSLWEGQVELRRLGYESGMTGYWQPQIGVESH